MPVSDERPRLTDYYAELLSIEAEYEHHRDLFGVYPDPFEYCLRINMIWDRARNEGGFDSWWLYHNVVVLGRYVQGETDVKISELSPFILSQRGSRAPAETVVNYLNQEDLSSAEVNRLLDVVDSHPTLRLYARRDAILSFQLELYQIERRFDNLTSIDDEIRRGLIREIKQAEINAVNRWAISRPDRYFVNVETFLTEGAKRQWDLVSLQVQVSLPYTLEVQRRRREDASAMVREAEQRLARHEMEQNEWRTGHFRRNFVIRRRSI
jgi:hypothetical protein